MFEQSPLPYDRDALEPVISKETIDFHYGKHHAAYVKNLNNLIKDTTYESMSLVEIIQTAPAGTIFNNAAQIWNHEFQWNSLTPNNPDVGQVVPDVVASYINRFWPSVEVMKTELITKATKHFGSGWAWLNMHPDGSLFTQTSPDAETPIADPEITPIFVIDLWEHAYYIDYRNDRAEYLEKVWSLLNWDFIRQNLNITQDIPETWGDVFKTSYDGDEDD